MIPSAIRRIDSWSGAIRQRDSERRKTEDRFKLVRRFKFAIGQIDCRRYRYTQHQRAKHEYYENQSSFALLSGMSGIIAAASRATTPGACVFNRKRLMRS